MKKYLILFILFLGCLAHAQTTAVTATIQAPDGQAFIKGSVVAVFTPPGGTINQNLYKLNGAAFPYIVSATLDGTGTFTMNLTDDHVVRPLGGRWMFSVCSIASTPCTSSLQDVFGASLNLSTSINADVKSIFEPATQVKKFMSDTEAVTDPNGGTIYFNVVSNKFRCWNSIAWSDCAGSGGGGSGTVTSVSTGNGSPLFNANIATPTTTPALSFSMLNAAANTYYGNSTNGSALPNFNVIDWIHNPAGNSYVIDGKLFSDLDALVTTLCGSSIKWVKIDVKIIVTMNQDEWHVCTGQILQIHFNLQSTPYTVNASQRIAPRGMLSGDGPGNTGASIATNLQAGASFPASVATPTAAPNSGGSAPVITLTATGSLTAGASYWVTYNYGNTTGETDAAPAAQITMDHSCSGGTADCHGFTFTSPPASSNATFYSVFVTDPNGPADDVSWEATTALGNTTTITTESLADGDPPTGYNFTGAVISLGSGSLKNGFRVIEASLSEIGENVWGVLIDCNGIKHGLPAGADGRTGVINLKSQEQSAIWWVSVINAGSDGVFQNAAVVAEGCNGGRCANNSKIDTVQILDVTSLNNCGAGGTDPCNPLQTSVFSDQVKSLRGMENISSFMVSGVTKSCYKFKGPTGVNADTNISGLLLKGHCEGKTSSMNYGVEVIGMPLMILHFNTSSTTGGIAGIHIDAGSGGTHIIDANFGPNRPMQDDTCNYLSPAGDEGYFSDYDTGLDCDHRKTTHAGIPTLTYTGGWTANSAITRWQPVKLATGVDNKVVPVTSDTDSAIGIAITDAPLGTSQVDVAFGGTFAPGRGPILSVSAPGACAANDLVYPDPAHTGQVFCPNGPRGWANRSIGKAVAANSTPGTSVQITIAIRPAKGYKIQSIPINSIDGTSVLTAPLFTNKTHYWIAGVNITIWEVIVSSNHSAVSVNLEREIGGTPTNIMSAELATAAGGAYACANNTGGNSVILGIPCANQLTITSMNAGNSLGISSVTIPGGSTLTNYNAAIVYTED